jgi:hypothetical protein
MSIGLGVASDRLSNIQAQNATAAQERQGQIEAGMNERERYWFDPNSDVVPTLSEYMDGMPSQRDALLESGLFGKAGNTRGGRVAASFANPIAAGQNAYIQDKSGKMALSGAATGMSIGGGLGAAVGAVAGAIVGLIEGAVGWNAAKAADKTARNQRRRQYFAKVKAWYATRRKQIAEARKAQAADMRARLTAGSLSNIQRSQAIGAAKKEEKKQSREENRVNVLNMLQNAMQAQELMRSEGLKNTTVGRRAIA